MIKTVENSKVHKMEKLLLCLFSGLSANGVGLRHAVRFVLIPHVSVTVLYYGQFQSFSMLKLPSAAGE
jgi:hypothetical protein